MRNQILAVVGHKPSQADALPAFHREYPQIAAAVGLAPDPKASNAERLVAAFEALSTRVDAQ